MASSLNRLDLTINVETAQLVAILQENRTKHAAEYETAIVNYRSVASARLQKVAADIASGKHVALHMLNQELPRPENHTETYDDALAMLQMTGDKTIALTTEMYTMLVKDDWAWKETFRATAASYSGAIGAAFGNVS